MPRRARAAAGSCCGSRISTRRAAGPSSSTASTRTCAGSASNGTSRSLVQSQRTQTIPAALDAVDAHAASSMPASAPAPTSPQSLTAPHGDAATSYPGTCRALPDDPERRATTPHCWRLDSAKALAIAGPASLDRSRRPALRRRRRARSATRSSPARMRPRAIILPASSTMRRAA